MFSISRIILFTILHLTIVVGAPSNTDNVVDCPAWPYPNNELTWAPKACIAYKDVVVDGGRAQICREAVIPSPKTNGIIRTRLFATRGRVAEVVNFYATNLRKNLQNPLAINLTMVHEDKVIVASKPGVEAATNTHTGGRPCHVVVKIIPSEPKTWIAHLVAHELYHCVQRQEHPDRSRTQDDLIWILDGTANFFEYLQYPYDPPKEIDENAPHFYEPSEALYSQQYISCLFFHYLHNSNWSLLRIDSWVRQRNLTTSDLDERVLLAADSEISSAFGRFATKFHDKKIYFDAKKLLRIKTANPVPEQPLQDVSLAAEGDVGRLEFGKVDSWTFKKYSLRLQSRQTISASTKWAQQPAPKVIVWYRRLRAGNKSSPWARTLPKILHSGCGSTSVTYEFLVVPVAKEQEVEGFVELRREKDAKCSCPSKTSGGGTITRDLRSWRGEVLAVRQLDNGSGACMAPREAGAGSRNSHVSLQTIKIADVIRSIMGYPVAPSLATVNTGAIEQTASVCVAKSSQTEIAGSLGIETPIRYPTQQTNDYISYTSTASVTAVGNSQTIVTIQVSQLFESPKQSPTASASSSTMTPPITDTWTEDDEIWDESWEMPDTSPPAEDSTDEIHDSDTAPPEEAEEDCEKPKVGCLFGSWTADTASMENHVKKPYFRYSPPPFSPANAKISATYKFTFFEAPASDQTESKDQYSMSYHEQLIESGENSAAPGQSHTFLQWISTTTIDGSMEVSAQVLESPEVGTYETGNIYKMPSANTSSVGEIKIALDHGPFTVLGRDGGTAFGPNGLSFSYNCTADTLHFGYALSNSRNYVMHRV